MVRPDFKFRVRVRNRTSREKSLLLAAAKLFASQGYETTTTRQIAAIAGCAEGLISRYFKGKAGLLSTLIQTHVSKKLMLSGGRMPAALDFEDQIVQLVSLEVEQTWRDRDFLKAIIPRALLDAKPNPSQIALSREMEHLVRKLKQFDGCRGLNDQKITLLANLVNATGLMFGFWYPAIMGEDLSTSKQSAMIMGSLLAKQFHIYSVANDEPAMRPRS